jgi:hypothetical protein
MISCSARVSDPAETRDRRSPNAGIDRQPAGTEARPRWRPTVAPGGGVMRPAPNHRLVRRGSPTLPKSATAGLQMPRIDRQPVGTEARHDRDLNCVETDGVLKLHRVSSSVTAEEMRVQAALFRESWWDPHRRKIKPTLCISAAAGSSAVPLPVSAPTPPSRSTHV